MECPKPLGQGPMPRNFGCQPFLRLAQISIRGRSNPLSFPSPIPTDDSRQTERASVEPTTCATEPIRGVCPERRSRRSGRPPRGGAGMSLCRGWPRRGTTTCPWQRSWLEERRRRAAWSNPRAGSNDGASDKLRSAAHVRPMWKSPRPVLRQITSPHRMMEIPVAYPIQSR